MNSTRLPRALLAVGLAMGIAAAAATPAAAAATGASPGQDCGYFIETGVSVCVPHGADLNGAIYTQTGKTVVEMSANGVTALTAPESKPASSGMTVSPASNSFIGGIWKPSS